MIEDLASYDQLIAPGVAERIGVALQAPAFGERRALTFEQVGLRVLHGQAVVGAYYTLPIVAGRTCSAHFLEYNLSKYQDPLATPPPPTHALTNALVMVGSANHYHFFHDHLSALLLANALAGDTVTIVLNEGFPPRASGLITRLLPHLAGGRPVRVVHVVAGSYAVENCIFPIRAPLSIATPIAQQIILPFVLAEAGRADPWQTEGPLKLFVRRAGGGTGRVLLNQGDVEQWFAARGFTAVDPGTLSIEAQIMLFARATHVAGVEGAAMTNIIFAPRLARVVMLASGNARHDRFFQQLIERYEVPFYTLFGPPQGPARNDDFTLPLAALDALPPDATR